jgi:hypothetical protein
VIGVRQLERHTHQSVVLRLLDFLGRVRLLDWVSAFAVDGQNRRAVRLRSIIARLENLCRC